MKAMEDKMKNQVDGNGLTQFDPLSKPKKWTVGLTVCIMILMMLATFVAFHWLYSEYFSFAASKSASIQKLADIKAMCSEAERESKSRIVAAEEEFSRKKNAIEEIHRNRSRELDEELDRKKKDFASLIKGFKERYDSTTNDLSVAIRAQEAELQRLSTMNDSLLDVRRQYETVSNALVRAILSRDNALRIEREAQGNFNEWNVKIGNAKAQLAQVENKRSNLIDELTGLETATNNVSINLSIMSRKVTEVNAELQTVSNAITSASVELSRLRSLVSKASDEAKAANAERDAAKKDKKTAEFERDKMQNECMIAKSSAGAAKSELEGTIKEAKKSATELARIKGEIETQAAMMQSARIELQSVSNKIELANMRLTEIARQIETAKREQKIIDSEKVQCEKDKNEALDRKREAESLRDKAIAEKELAEKRLKERKPEIEVQIAEMEKRLGVLKGEVLKAEQKKAADNQTKGETK
jgi:chromosome segregation ATPase